MNAVVYYFTGTGNSLAVARDIAEKLSAELVSIAALINQEEIKTGADLIGIVFPMYHHGIPGIVQRFVDKISDLEKKYIFGVCTYGFSPGICLEYLERVINENGGRLAAGFAVNMPYNYIIPSLKLRGFFKSFALNEISSAEQQKMFAECKARIQEICEYIQARKKGRLETKGAAIEHLVDSLKLRETVQKSVWLKVAGFAGKTDLSFIESLKLMDYGFKYSDSCNGCGICSMICPVKNIILVEGKPVWQHRCEQCFACLQWCPEEAVQFRNGTLKGKRYHHPAVELSDMMRSGG